MPGAGPARHRHHHLNGQPSAAAGKSRLGMRAGGHRIHRGKTLAHFLAWHVGYDPRRESPGISGEPPARRHRDAQAGSYFAASSCVRSRCA